MPSLRRTRMLALALAGAGTLALSSCSSPGADPRTDGPTGSTTTPTPAPTTSAVPVDVQVVADGLDLPWDVQLLPDGSPLVTERGGRLLHLSPSGGGVTQIQLDLPDLFVGSETGLMGMALSPTFAQDRTLYLCHGTQSGGTPRDVRVTRWTLDPGLTRASAAGDVVTGLPITSGRHAGCRLLIHEGTLYVGTGDAADETNPQSLTSLGGKVLAMTLDGRPLTDAPFVDGNPLIWTYGHRNVQGLAVQPGTGAIWSVEHGPSVDDEVNVNRPGANYGWDPGPGYDEHVPMTDTQKFPDAVPAVWSSGDPTHATSGATFLQGAAWGRWQGDLAVAELKGSGVTVLDVEGEKVVGQTRMPELDHTHGRLRSLTLGPDGALWVTTSNGSGDQVLRVTPRG